MRKSAVVVWLFTNLLFFGLCGYMYLVWSQYWLYNEKLKHTSKTVETVVPEMKTKVIVELDDEFASRGDGIHKKVKRSVDYNRSKTEIKNDNVTITYGKPRFPNTHNPLLQFDTSVYSCYNTSEKCKERIGRFAELVDKEFHRVLMDESNVFKSGSGTLNIYNVTYKGSIVHHPQDVTQINCDLKAIEVRTIMKSDESFVSKGFLEVLPSEGLMDGKHYNTCAVISNAASIIGSKLGAFIDSHDWVMRFNSAPTDGFEFDVGSKTSIRILNSKVVSQPQFKFMSSPMYRNITLLAWDPSNYSATLEEWLRRPDHRMFARYKRFLKKHPSAEFHLLHPKVLWSLWDVLQKYSNYRIRRNPPSSGFLAMATRNHHNPFVIGIWLALHKCNHIRVMEYIPTVRLTKRCHYWEKNPDDSSGCTIGTWHPLAQEKSLAMLLAEGDLANFDVFQRGFLDLKGFKYKKCKQT